VLLPSSGGGGGCLIARHSQEKPRPLKVRLDLRPARCLQRSPGRNILARAAFNGGEDLFHGVEVLLSANAGIAITRFLCLGAVNALACLGN
jgi:hypothetical protein